ncbi:MAG TPA: TIGR03809 family protein [Pseudolabrys sp.]|nr:TIGR03809 family protein [Pseudolabrys sp.]
MAAMQIGTCFDKIAEKWHALAQRRLAYIRELERSGRWQRYYTQELYALCLSDAERAVMVWAKLATGRSASGPNADHVRPAA